MNLTALLTIFKTVIKSNTIQARTIEFKKQTALGHAKKNRGNDYEPHFIDIANSLHRYSVVDLRPSARVALLIYGFLRKVPYIRMEDNSRNLPDFKAMRYSLPVEYHEEFDKWVEAGVHAYNERMEEKVVKKAEVIVQKIIQENLSLAA